MASFYSMSDAANPWPGVASKHFRPNVCYRGQFGQVVPVLWGVPEFHSVMILAVQANVSSKKLQHGILLAQYVDDGSDLSEPLEQIPVRLKLNHAASRSDDLSHMVHTKYIGHDLRLGFPKFSGFPRGLKPGLIAVGYVLDRFCSDLPRPKYIMSRLFGLRGFFCRDINKNEAIRTCAAYRGTYEGDRSMNRRILLHSLMLKDTAVRGGDLENMGGVLSDVSPSPDMVALLLPGLFDPGDSLVTARDAGGLEVGNAAQSRSAQVSVEREKVTR
ncbi:hypothetical protein BDZ89DRAFT_1142460 [Hymenopellis radicata]|nr:hypothetical protein BDZ89DRAFT_1142460 [Hymenopellis radicata]